MKNLKQLNSAHEAYGAPYGRLESFVIELHSVAHKLEAFKYIDRQDLHNLRLLADSLSFLNKKFRLQIVARLESCPDSLLVMTDDER